jgi:DNA-directed RNA polymerase subunit beta
MELIFSDQRYNLGVGRYRMNKKLGCDIPMERKQVLTEEDIITIVKYLIELVKCESRYR